MKTNKLQRLKCGCLVKCRKDGNNIWIQNKCKKSNIPCQIDKYVKEHKSCLICGICIKCFPDKHKECNKWYRIFEKIYIWGIVKISYLFY